MKGVARVTVAAALMAAIGLLSFGLIHSTWAAAATWSSYGNVSGEGHDLTPVVALQNGDLMAIGGFNGSTPTNDVEILDHGTKTWRQTTSTGDALPASYGAASLAGAEAVVLSGGDVLLSGGRDESGAPLNAAAVWNHLNEGQGAAGLNWAVFPGQPMDQGRDEHSVVALKSNNEAVIIGGSCSGHSDTEVFTEGAHPPFVSVANCSFVNTEAPSRTQAAAVLTSRGDVILTGGTGTSATLVGNPPPGTCVNASDEADVLLGADIASSPGSASWHAFANSMSEPSPPPPSAASSTPSPCASAAGPVSGSRLRHIASEVEIAGNLFVVVAGGAAREGLTPTTEGLDYPQSSTEVYSASLTDPGTGHWQTGQSLPSARADLASIRVGNKVLIAGGRAGGTQADPADGSNGRGLTDAFIYDPTSRSSSPTLSMSSGRLNFTLAPAPSTSGKIVAVGGFRAPTASQNKDVEFATQAELYTPSSIDVTPTPSPTPTTPTPTPRPVFNPGKHPPTLSLPVVHPGALLRIKASGLDPGSKFVIFIQPITVNALEECALGQKVSATASATGTIDTTVVAFDQGPPQLAVTLCVVAPPPNAPSAAPVAQAVGRAQLIMQPRSLEPPFVGVGLGA